MSTSKPQEKRPVWWRSKTATIVVLTLAAGAAVTPFAFGTGIPTGGSALPEVVAGSPTPEDIAEDAESSSATAVTETTASGGSESATTDPATESERTGPSAVTGADEHSHDAGKTVDVPAPPQLSDDSALRTEPGEEAALPSRPSDTSGPGAPGPEAPESTGCASDVAYASGSALVSALRSSSTSCVNELFSLTGSQAASTFSESNMTAVANAFYNDAAAYTGDNSAGTAQLVLYLRAGYYVQWYNADVVGAYSSNLRQATAYALDAFFASSHSQDVTDANGEILAEAVTLIDSAELNARYLDVVKRLLTSYDSSYDSSYWMLMAVNNVYTVLFRGHQVPEFVTAVSNDPSVLTTLRDFAVRHMSLLGGEQSYLVSNAGRELARFLGDAAVKNQAKPLVIELLGMSDLNGSTSALWVGLAEMTDYYDKAACADYGTCALADQLQSSVLTQRRTCSESIVIVSQSMTDSEFNDTCASLTGQDAFFHAVVKDNGPVADDYNTTVEVVVFDSSTDYQSYAGALFGIDTNNGGMYLEGNPAAAGNQPRFIAYEAEWVRPTFEIWNLNHEYTHYLDGRFDMYGDFTANISTPTIWWIEGAAEAIAYSYRGVPYAAAQSAAAAGTYRLSDLWNTTYSSDTTRIYRWGYLAAMFMLTQHPQEMQTVLGYYRTGQWNAAYSYLTQSIGSTYDSEFSYYLQRCAAGDCGNLGATGTPTPEPSASESAEPSVEPSESVPAVEETPVPVAPEPAAEPSETPSS